MSSVPVVDPGEGPTLPPLFLDQTKAQKAKKFFSRPPPLPQGLDDCPPPPLSKGLNLPLNPQLNR